MDEIHHYGGDDPRIRARLRALLSDLHAVARPEYRAMVARKLASWDERPADGRPGQAPSDIGLRTHAAPPTS